MHAQDLADDILARAEGAARFFVALAGAPGSGKSTLAADLAEKLGSGAAILPMDGFHLGNDVLRARGLFERKGAPETFDVAGFAALLARVRAGGAVPVPTFDRAADRVVPGGDAVPAAARIIVAEGNYLLLDRPDWRALHGFWDYSVLIDVPEPVLEERLIGRWLAHGMSRRAAEARARGNDLANAAVVRGESIAPDRAWTVSN